MKSRPPEPGFTRVNAKREHRFAMHQVNDPCDEWGIGLRDRMHLPRAEPTAESTELARLDGMRTASVREGHVITTGKDER